jgi:acetyl-CoA carboxylase carboxyltransferase component
MGPQQLAGVMSIVARQSALSQGKPFDEDADEAMRKQIEEQIERESLALFMTGKLYDDGIIDPRDTRTVLGMCLSAIDNTETQGTRGYGVFRM